jgi:hypothetical protein
MVHCIQDTDGDGKYEWLIKDPVFPQKPAFMLAEVYTHTDLRRTNPIEVEPAPSQDLPISTADLIATGIASRIMTPEGHYRPNIYRFSFKMRAPEYVKRPTTSSTVIKNFDVELDRNGAGQLRSSNGTLLIEVRNAKMDGSAEVRLHNILEPGIGPIFDRETDLQYARKFKQGFEAIAVNARTGQPIDMSVFMSPDE